VFHSFSKRIFTQQLPIDNEKAAFSGVLGFWRSALGRHVKGPLQGVGRQLESFVCSPETIQPKKNWLNGGARRGDADAHVGKRRLMAQDCR
jgi:hypothetical protein